MTYTTIILFVASIKTFAQETTNLYVGVGFAETAHIGFRADVHNQLQLGMSIGTWPSPNDLILDWKSLISVSVDCYMHFGDSAGLSTLRPWYIRTGLDFYRISYDEEDVPVETDLEYHLRIGRDFYFSRNSGVSLDAGMALFLVNETGFTTLLPALGMSLFYRF